MRTFEDIDQAIKVLQSSEADAVVSVAKVDDPHPFKMMLVNGGVIQPLFPDQWRETLRRQDCPPVYYLNGAIYCVRRSVLLDHNSLWGKKTLPYVMPPERSVNVDSLLDLKLAECLLAG